MRNFGINSATEETVENPHWSAADPADSLSALFLYSENH
jgi:hypothetical protein